MIVIIDCGMGNLQSVVRAFERIGAAARASSAIADVEAAQRLVLPGVGSLAHGMEALRAHGLLPLLRQQVLERRIPVLGICVGHQMLTRMSEEGNCDGLGWVDGETTRFRFAAPQPVLKVPHLGWNTLRRRRDCALLDGIPEDACFYFAHSYKVTCDDAATVAATADYGGEFVAVLHRDNIFGTQFHPEKSQAHGLRVLRNFVGHGS